MNAYILKTEEGSFWVEWIAEDKRFGISIEKDLKESGWYYTDRHGTDGTLEHGDFPIKELLDFIKQNAGVV